MKTRSLLCSTVLLSVCYVACSSSSDGGSGDSKAGAAGNASAGAAGRGNVAGAAGLGNGAGAAGTPVTGGGAAGTQGQAGAAGAVPAAGAAGMGMGMGGAGTAGSMNTAGAAGMIMVDVGQSVTQRGGDSARTAHWVESNLTQANVAKMAMDTDFKATFTGEMSAVPLFLASTTPGQGVFFAVTTQNMVYALNETTGAIKWMHSIGAQRTGGPGPGINNRGIVSTPVIDAASRTIYMAASMASNKHEIHALNVDTGNEVNGWPVDVSKVTSGNVAFNSNDQNQRSALSLVNGIVYVAFGGYYGDGGNYHGWVVSVNASDPTKVAGWATLGGQEGIWAAGGLASDGNGVFAITGNSGANARGNTDSEEVIRITGMSVPNRDNNNLFYPDIWASGMNNGDKDFGSCSPSLITVPNSTPSKVLVAPAKPGRVYFLDAAKLGGPSGQFSDLVVAGTGQESVYTAPTTYPSPSGTYVTISTQINSVCPNGVSNGNIMGILMKPGTPPMPQIKWCASMNSGDDEVRRRSPISTTSSAAGADPVVWFMSGSNLVAFNGETGTALPFTSGTCDGVHRFTSPIAANGRIIVGGNGHLCSWSVH